MSNLNDLTALKIVEKGDSFIIKNREGDKREFKLLFENEKLWKYAQTMVAFANRDGGVIFFGIKDKPHELIGIAGNEPEDQVFANFLNSYFEPEISFKLDTLEINGKKLFYILVYPAINKPIICKKEKNHQEKGKNSNQLREGAIYYRYSSTNHEIKYPELRNILDEQTNKKFNNLLNNMKLIHQVGVDSAAIVNVNQLSSDNKSTSIYITTETAKNMNWIAKGRFSETEDQAEKAFFVTREVELKKGIEIEKQVLADPSVKYPYTKKVLQDKTKITANNINAVLNKLNLINNEEYCFIQKRGEQNLQNFSDKAVEKILLEYPIDMENRKNILTALRKKDLELKQMATQH